MEIRPSSGCTVESDLGFFTIGGTEDAVTSVLLPNADRPPIETTALSDPVRLAADQVAEFHAGQRHAFTLPLEASGTPFQLAVWAAVAAVPWGETRSYGQIADVIGRPASARPVGQAVGRNPLPLIWPCHRVVASDGLGGYDGGLDLKMALLAREGVVV